MLVCTIFDYNGVLVDDESLHLESFRSVVAELGLTFSDEEYWSRYIGFDDREGFSAILSDNGREAPAALVETLVARKKPAYIKLAERRLKGFEGVAELVRACASVGPVIVVSGALRAEIELGLALLGVDQLVEHIVAAEDAPRSKPDPQGYQLGIEYLTKKLSAAQAKSALVIEDSVAGVQAARSAGLCVVAVQHSYPAEALLAAGAQHTVAHIRDLSVARLNHLIQQHRDAGPSA